MPRPPQSAVGSGGGNSKKKSKDAAPRASASGKDGGDEGSDPRFARFRTDPLYRLPSKRQTHAAVDSRFSRMFNDDAFTSRAKVDRYGRKLPKSKDGNQNMKRLYRLEKDEKPKQKIVTEEEEADEDEEEDEDGGVSIADDDEIEKELKRLDQQRPGYDPARDGGFGESSSEEETSDEDSDEEDLEEDAVEESGLAARDADEIPDGEVSKRLAVVNLDWDNIRAVDLMVVLGSFTTTGGRIKRVTVYPSEFGKERMAREELEGPPKELFLAKKAPLPQPTESDPEEDEEEENEEEEDERIRKSLVQEQQAEDFDSVELRKYQLERLQYFYAVVECSSEKCSKEIYDSVDGLEYLSTANFFDLRFIPDETDFSGDRPRDACTEVPDGYKPNEFSTHALQHSKVKLTWDADDTTRKEAQKRAFSRAEIDENDLKAYLASDSSGDEYDGAVPEVVDATAAMVQDAEEADKETKAAPKLDKKEASRQRMRELLGLPKNETKGTSKKSIEPVGDMQITFHTALAGPKGGSIFENEPVDPNESTRDKYVRKEKERKARRKEKMKTARQEANGEAEPEPEGAAEESKEDLGFDDPFFAEPTSAPSAASKSLSKEQKRKKRAEKEAEEVRNAADRAALQKIMDDGEEAGNDGGVRHFDIAKLRKAEKTLRKTKGKKARLKPGEKAAIEAKNEDDFRMDVADDRFANRLDQPQFAVDASNPNFDKTEGMQALLEARRKKRARETAAEDGDGASEARTKKAKASGGDADDLKKLVQRVKGRSGT